MSSSNTLMVPILLIVVIILVADAARECKKSTIKKDDKIELKRQLKAINKPAIISFKGEIFDCIVGGLFLGVKTSGIGQHHCSKDTSLAKGASLASWGGQVYSLLRETGPAMGRGHLAKEGFKKVAFINSIQIIDGSGRALIPQIYTYYKDT